MIMTAQLMTLGDIILQPFWHIAAARGTDGVQRANAVEGASYRSCGNRSVSMIQQKKGIHKDFLR